MSGFEPLATHQHQPLVAEWEDAPVSETGARDGHVRSTRTEGTTQQSGSSAAERRPHKAKAGGSCPPRTTSSISRTGGMPRNGSTTTTCAFEVTSKRRNGFPSETAVKRGDRIVRGTKELREKLGRNDPCPCGSAGSFLAMLPAQRLLLTV